MISSKNVPQSLIAGLLGVLISTATLSADIAHSIRNNTEEKTTTENYLELGLGVAVGRGPSLTDDDNSWAAAYWIINGSYNWKGLFIEKYGESNDPLLLGYNAYESENWSLDLVVGPRFGGLHFNDRFDALDDRNSSTMFGGRLTGYIGKNVLQFSLKHDISGNSHGTIASALVGRNWQIRNWNFHSLLGLQVSDSRITDYYRGVSVEEAQRSEFTAYDAGSSVSVNAEVGVTYPISEDWVFRSTVRARTIDDSMMDSPLYLTPRNNAVGLSTSLSYVF
jgi:outer membrane protein